MSNWQDRFRSIGSKIGSWYKALLGRVLERISLLLPAPRLRWGAVAPTRPVVEGFRRMGIVVAICLAPVVCCWIWSKVMFGHALPTPVYIYLLMAGIALVAPSIDWIVAGFTDEESL